MPVTKHDYRRIAMSMPTNFPDCIDQLIYFKFGQILTATVICVLESDWNIPVYGYWRASDGELQNHIAACCHCVNFP
jgi:hypothetical protein